MKGKASIRLKAAILFVVFSLNTMRSLACAVNLDSVVDAVCDAIHHHNSEAEEATESLMTGHNESTKHHHHDSENGTEKDNCCDTKVVSFDLLDKAISHNVTANLDSPVFVLPTFLFLNTTIDSGACSMALNYILRNFHSPPEDIRVSIRSFQI